MKLMTDAIGGDGHFDPRYTCDFDNSSPELRWSEAPEGTASFAVIAEDLDARDRSGTGTFNHWVVHAIPPSISHLPAGIPAQETLPNGIRQGINGFGKLGYGGPCPPADGHEHRYVFRLYALRQMPPLEGRLTQSALLTAISPLVMATAEIRGRYARGELRRAG